MLEDALSAAAAEDVSKTSGLEQTEPPNNSSRIVTADSINQAIHTLNHQKTVVDDSGATPVHNEQS